MKPQTFPVTLLEADQDDDGPIDEAATAKAAAIAAARSLDAILDQKDIDDEIKGQARGLRATLRKKWADLKSTKDPDEKPTQKPQERADATEAAVIDDWSQIALEEGQEAPGKFNVRIIRPGWGASGYYSAATLESAAKDRIFGKGLKMYWNHPTTTEQRERPERDLRDLAGVLEGDARWDPDGKEGPGLYAPIATVAHYRESVKELAPYIGVSIRGDGRGRVGEVEGKKGRIIEAITAAKSVDFVTAPGAGGKVLELFEAARATNHTTEDNEMDLEEARRELEAEKAKGAKLTTALKEATDERDRALVAVAAIEARSLAQEQLSGVKLPDATKERIIESVARQVPLDDDGEVDRKAVKALVEAAAKEEATYLAKVLGKGRIEGMGDSQEGDGDQGDKSPQALKESQDALGAAFARLGLGEKEVVHAVTGR